MRSRACDVCVGASASATWRTSSITSGLSGKDEVFGVLLFTSLINCEDSRFGFMFFALSMMFIKLQI